MTKKKIDMKTLEKEAEEYSDYKNDYVPMSFGDKFNPTTKRDFIAGANSKWVQAKLKECWDAAHQAGRFEGKGIAEENWQTFEDWYNENII